MGLHHVTVHGIPTWVPAHRLLGDDWTPEADTWTKQTSRSEAADLLARLRKLSLGGQEVRVDVRPPLKRNAIRQGRLDEARRRRNGSVGFSRPNVRLDEEGRFSLTPEKIAYSLGQRAAPATVLDACCGAGGNAIGFARAGCRVVAIDSDAQRLRLARHNATVYGVERRIQFHHGDARQLYRNHQADLLFIDPPWGAWDPVQCGLADFPLLHHLVTCSSVRSRYTSIWAKVPSSFDATTVSGAIPEAIFGVNSGDRRHVKFVLLRLSPTET